MYPKTANADSSIFYSLVIPEIITPYPEHYPLEPDDLAFRSNLPTVAPLAVNKQIGAEAASTLYGKNIWRVTSTAPGILSSSKTWLNFGWSRHGSRTLWAQRANLFRRILVVFDQRDLDPDTLIETTRLNNHPVQTSDPDARMKTMHDEVVGIMSRSWDLKFDATYEMGGLVEVRYDVERLYCAIGCCREEMLFKLFGEFGNQRDDGDLDGGGLKLDFRLVVKGLKGQEERDLPAGLGVPAVFAEDEDEDVE